jgi:hypothetical protein
VLLTSARPVIVLFAQEAIRWRCAAWSSPLRQIDHALDALGQ